MYLSNHSRSCDVITLWFAGVGVNDINGNLFSCIQNYVCTKIEVSVRVFVNNIRLENQGTEQAVICQIKYDVRFVEFL
jgi:hypothetical protein